MQKAHAKKMWFRIILYATCSGLLVLPAWVRDLSLSREEPGQFETPLPAVLSWQAFKLRAMSHHVDEGGAVFRAIHLDGDIVILLALSADIGETSSFLHSLQGPDNDWSAPGFPSDPYHERPPSPPGTCHLAGKPLQ